ncbi:hypothetical protein EUGRSUZ_K00298 [Eucalyptus grandis]|uniref:Uncharacterized protein n=2 Tax=Eucalyptus grandis TaxID=71139 RepID=A0A058ZZI1_EUCGR|nr:hypothetical protein EUGRSUZ_K00298 [Eucalyptus grandis]
MCLLDVPCASLFAASASATPIILRLCISCFLQWRLEEEFSYAPLSSIWMMVIVPVHITLWLSLFLLLWLCHWDA